MASITEVRYTTWPRGAKSKVPHQNNVAEVHDQIAVQIGIGIPLCIGWRREKRVTKRDKVEEIDSAIVGHSDFRVAAIANAIAVSIGLIVGCEQAIVLVVFNGVAIADSRLAINIATGSPG